MPRQFVYRCTRCHRQPSENDNEARALLTVKSVMFKEVGYRGRPVRQRVVDWLCPDCLSTDEHFITTDRSIIDSVAADRAQS